MSDAKECKGQCLSHWLKRVVESMKVLTLNRSLGADRGLDKGLANMGSGVRISLFCGCISKTLIGGDVSASY